MQNKDHKLREKLTAEQYHITQEKGTERPFSGLYVDNKQAGIYNCIVCDAQLFNAEHKYDSGSGWPSFYKSLDTLRIEVDDRHGMHREEVLCKNCGAHLGHIFSDGPEPTGMRYCINSSALSFESQPDSKVACDADSSTHDFEHGCSERLVGTHYVLGNLLTPPYPTNLKLAVFGLGCFWGAEKCFWELDGVYSTAVGYAGGSSENPTYKEVCHTNTGHIEVVLVVYDESILPFQQLLNRFWESHNPTQGMRQGNDVGEQYQSVIYVFDETQLRAAKASLSHYQHQLNESGHQNKITTQISTAPRFYFAEDYHQQYLAKNVNGYCGLGGLGVSCNL